MGDAKLKIQSNTLNSASPFTQRLVLANDYYEVRMSYTDFVTSKANGTLDKNNVSVVGDPYNNLCAPYLTGTGNNILITFKNAMVSREAGFQELKESIAVVESMLAQIDEILDEYFTN